jgi:hypothetical protein
MNIVRKVSWTDIPTEIMATSTICNHDSVRILFGTDSDQNGMLEEIPRSGI